MSRLLISRFGQFFVVVAGALLVAFVALHVVADPAVLMAAPGATDAELAEFRELHGLDDPVLQQAARYFGGALRADFGESLSLGGSAIERVLGRLPATVMLVAPAVLLGAAGGLALGSFTARRRDSNVTGALNSLSYGMISVPEFWLAIMLIFFVAVKLDWLPTSGYNPKPQVMVMPALVIALKPFAHTYQLAQATMGAEYGKLYVLAARAKGVSEGSLARRHVWKNVAIPIMAIVLYDLARVFVGTAIVVEIVFAWPGIGRLAVHALSVGDVYLVQAVVLVAAVATATMNLLGDVLYYFVDPRARTLIRSGKRR